MIKIEDFNLDNILIDEQSFEDILVYNISYTSLIAKPLLLGSKKSIDLSEFMMELDV